MNETGIARPSGLKPPSKIARPCFGTQQKPAVPQTPKLNGATPSVRKLSDDMAHTRIMDIIEEQTEQSVVRTTVLPNNDRKPSDASVILTEDTDSFIIGDRVWVGGTKPGQIAYIGETQFAPGDWAGVVLDEPIGKNDGSVGGVRYFQCENKRGVFSKLGRLTRSPLAMPELVPGTPAPFAPTAMITSTPLMSPSSSVKGAPINGKPRTPSISSPPSPGLTPNGDVKIGDRVIVMSSQGSKTGLLRFKGTTSFAAGEWCGVELDDPIGKNDGSVDGVRYFECEPKFGLFAPAQKVSKSPASYVRRPSCQVHHGSTVKRHGSKESINSVTSSVRTNPTITRKPLSSRPPISTPVASTKAPVQDILKAKQEQINELLKERDLVREKMTKAAEQADQAEKQYFTLQLAFNTYRTDSESKIEEKQKLIKKLEYEKQELLSQLEDVQFRAEEELINKSDIEVMNDQNLERIKELEDIIAADKSKYETLEKKFYTEGELETLLSQTKDELIRMTKLKEEAEDKFKKELTEAKNIITCLETDYKTLENKLIVLQKNDNEMVELTEKYNNQIGELKKIIDEYEHKTKVQEEEIEKLKTCLIEKIDYTEKYENENKKLSCIVDSMKKAVITIQTELESRTEKYKTETKKSEDKFNNDIQALTEQIQSSKTEYEKNKENFTKMCKELEEDKLKLMSDLKDLSEKHGKEISALQVELEETVKHLSQNEWEFSKLTDRHAESVKECSSLQEALLKLQNSLQEKNKNLAEKEEEISNLKMAVENIKIDKMKFEETCNQEVQEQKSKFDDINRALQKAHEDLQNAETQRNSQETDINSKLTMLEEVIKLNSSENSKLKEYIEQEKLTFNEQNHLLKQLEQEVKQYHSLTEAQKEEICSKNTMLMELDNKISSLKNEYSRLNEEQEQNLKVQVDRYNKLELEFGDCQRRLNTAEERCVQLSQQKEKLEADIAGLINNESTDSAQLSKLNNDLREKEKELEKFALNYADKSREAENREQELLLELSIKAQEYEQSLKSVLHKTEETTQSLEAKYQENLSELKQVISNSEHKLEVTIQSLNQKETLCQDLTGKLEVSEAQVKTLQNQLSLTEKDKSGLGTEFNNKIKEIENLNSEIKRVKEELMNNESERASLGTKVSDKNKEIIKLTESLQEVTKKNMHLTSQLQFLNEKESQLKQLEEEMKVLKAKCEEQRSLIDNLGEKKNNLQETVDNGMKEIKSKTELIENLTQELEHLKKINCSFGDDNNNLLEKVKKYEVEMNELEKKVNSLDAKCNELTQEKKKMLSDLLSLKHSSDNLSEIVFSLKGHIAEKDTELNQVIEAKAIKESEAKEAEAELRRQLTAAENENKNLTEELEKLKKTLDSNVQLEEKHSQNENELKKKLALALQENEKIGILSNEVKEKEEICRNLEMKIKDLEASLTNSNEDKNSNQIILNQFEQKINELENKLKLSNQEVNELTALKNSIEKKLEENETAQKRLVDESQSMKHQLHNGEKENKEKVLLFEEEIKQLKVQKDNFEKLYQEKDNRLTSALIELDTLKRSKSIQNNVPDANSNSNDYSEEREFAESQINFLNSIIVDLQNKNDSLKARIEALELGTDATVSNHQVGKVRVVAPRLFCDICDVFDVHDTEDCPRQATDSPIPMVQHHHRPHSRDDRPYCDICEVFGHDTANCDDGETF